MNTACPPAPPTPILPRHPEWVKLYWRGVNRGYLPALAPAEFDSSPGTYEECCAELAHRVAALQRQGELSQAQWRDLSSLLLTGVIGIAVDAAQNQILWRLAAPPPVGVENLRLNGQPVSLKASAEIGQGTLVTAACQRPFALEIVTSTVTYVESVPGGRTTYTLTLLDGSDVVDNG